MKRKSPADKLEKKRAAWISRTSEILSVDEVTAAELLKTGRKQSIRLNPLKAAPEETLKKLQALGWTGTPYTWMPEGYSMDTPVELIRDSEPVMKGAVFIQNAASWLPVLALDAQPGDMVLDVCAAPGGKTSHIAALTGNKAHIWANDSSKPRLMKLQANLERLGADVENLTLYDAQNLARQMSNQQFDRILIDAPCSGEGLRSLSSDKDVMGWSVAHIKRLQQEQKGIIKQAWQLLRPGGTLVYSTCTMAPEEDEAVVDYLLRSNDDVKVVPLELQLPNRVPAMSGWNGRQFSPELQGCMRLKPSEEIEAFFVCKLQKLSISD
jgi:NOL1/NOP2/sun family putative RNA methylase